MPSAALYGYVFDLPATDPELQEPFALAVEEYNEDRSDSANYFKVQSVMKGRYKGLVWEDYFLKVDFVKTTCEKKGDRLKYEKIQECERLPGNQEETTCYFLATKEKKPPFKMTLTWTYK